MGSIFTIGYSGHDMDSFIALLVENRVDVVCDVRSTPYSTYKPDFSRVPFRKHLNLANIKYSFFGDQLGARPKDRSCYIDGQATYQKISNSTFFKEGLERIRKGADMLNLALVCSEKDPIECHRAVLVCRHLDDIRSRILHIHTDGNVESQDDFDARLVGLHGLTPPPLLSTKSDWVDAVAVAYKKQGDAIAFRERIPPNPQGQST